MEIVCEFKYATWEDKTTKYYCSVTSSSITKPNTRIKSFTGVHVPGKSDNDVDAISFLNCTVEYFPKGLDQIFPRLEFIEMTRCGLKEITRKDLQNLEKFQGIYLESNELVSLPSNLFTNMRRLKRLSFYGNKLSSLSSQLLVPLKENDMRYIDFASNAKINAVFKPNFPCANVSSIEQLMNTIDATCSKPIEDEQNLMVEFMDDFLRGFKDFWTTGQLSDFVITVGLRTFRVHKCVLAIKSSVLAAVFKNKMQESKKSEMEIPDFSAEIVEQFLHYIYTGEIKDQTNAMDLFAIASKYNVIKLKSICEEIVMENLDESNAFEIFGLGHLYCSHDMKLTAFNEIKSIFPKANLIYDKIKKPEDIKELVDAKRHYDSVLKKFENLNV